MNRITLITLGLSIAACTGTSSDPSNPPSSDPTSSPTTPATEADYEDTAQTIASATATGGTGGLGFGDVLVFQDAMSLAHGRLPLGFLRATDGHFRGNLMGVGHDFTIACKDAAGNAQTACDSKTDSATVTIKVTGDLQTPIFSASIDREGSFTITGLQSATATFAGDSSFSLDTSLTSCFHQGGATSTLTFDATASYKAITIATADHTITGGSASFEVKGQRTVTGGNGSGGKGHGGGGGYGGGGGNGSGSGSGSGSGAGGGSGSSQSESFDVKADLTFNADQTATLVLDGTQTFTIDLKTGKITKN